MEPQAVCIGRDDHSVKVNILSPKLHATIKACPSPQADSIGKVVRAFFKIEQATLILATMGDDAEETPKGFEAAGTRYELRKVPPQEKNPEPPKTK